MATLEKVPMPNIRTETDSLGDVDVSADVVWGAQTQRSLEHLGIGHDLIPRGMITAYGTPKKAAAKRRRATPQCRQRLRVRELMASLCTHECFELLFWPALAFARW
jgi:fumarate hydratase class II